MDAIVSVTSDWAIGKDGGLLVPNKADMRRFVQLTRGCTVLMGRKTLESFPGGPLKGRRNVVVSRREGYAPEGVEVFSTPEAAYAAVKGDERAWLLGGASIYEALLDECERAYGTVNETTCEADSWFPNLDENDAWEVESREDGGVTEAGVPFEFVTYRHR